MNTARQRQGVPLPKREQRVFDLLVSRAGKVVSHLAIMGAMWGKVAPGEPDYQAVGECMSSLKVFLKGTPYEGRISNIRKFGFILDLPEETKAAA
jgi:DNA-binding winged helix-turn-helix (wHTH) protein